MVSTRPLFGVAEVTNKFSHPLGQLASKQSSNTTTNVPQQLSLVGYMAGIMSSAAIPIEPIFVTEFLRQLGRIELRAPTWIEICKSQGLAKINGGANWVR